MSTNNRIDNQNTPESESFEELSFKTRGGSSPQGKERVYFTCHPEDFDACFDTICQEIFVTQNCAIYYKDDLNATLNTEEMEIDLGRMQLFVIPITSKFLYHDNIARDVEFRFAVEHHIPILPLMQEGGLDSEFNRICGDLQFLDKNALANDSTALPYEKKLENFLASVLLGDELAAQVRDAFDAYIFMSYRKKDRKYAQELMRLIHKNDFCRDIAIWYDEFLVPGENFNQAIREAMEKSELFTFVLTPNILEPNNYVMEIEYPEAISAGKPILPAEMESTDRKLLTEYFKDIPDPADAYNDQVLTDYLTKIISRLDIARNNGDSIHLFFIGLAYLSGIDMEVDYDRAVNLITTAAEANLPEAMQKLSNMYKNAEGVERDYEISACWLEKLAQYWERKYNESGLEEDGTEYVQALCNEGDAWYEMERLESSKTIYEKVLPIAECLYEQFGGLAKKRNIAFCYERLGNISCAQGAFDDAKEYMRKSAKLGEELYLETNMSEFCRDLLVSYVKMGDICQGEGNLDEAKKWFEIGIDRFERSNHSEDTLESRRDLAAVYDRVGDIFLEEGKYSEAEAWFKEGLEMVEAFNRETDTVSSRRDLSVSYEKLGDICREEGELDKAWEWYTKCLKLTYELSRETETVTARKDLAIAYERLGAICFTNKNLSEAKKLYKECQKLREELWHETNSVEVGKGLAFAYHNLGNISYEEGDLSEAKKWYKKCQQLIKDHSELIRTVDGRLVLFLSYNGQGNISYSEREFSEAKERYLKGLELGEELSAETGMLTVRRKMATIYKNIGNLIKTEGDFSEAKKWYRKYLNIMDELSWNIRTEEALSDLMSKYDWWCETCESEGDFREAEEWYKKELALREKLNGKGDTAKARWDLSSKYMLFGNRCKSEKNLNEAKEWYLKSLELSEDLSRELGTEEAFNAVAVTCFVIGILDHHHLDVPMLRKAESVCTQLVERCPHEAKYVDGLRIIQKFLKETE